MAVASTGIAATLMPGGTTAHAGLKLPLNPASDQCPRFAEKTDGPSLRKKAEMQGLLFLIWDELVVAHRCLAECADRELKSVSTSRTEDVVFGARFFRLW